MNKDWTLELFMNQLGYELVSDDGIYAKYQNKGGTKSTFYGIMGRGKRLIYFNRDFDKNYVFVGIEEDGGTRRVFHGGCQTGEDLIKILELVY
jgi:hypothetical protein